MRFDENDFFRQATLRMCSSLNVDTALARLLEYLQIFVPMSGVCLGLLRQDLKSMRTIAATGDERHKPPDYVSFSDDVWRKFMQKRDEYSPVMVVNDVDCHGEPFEGEFMDFMFATREISVIFMELNIDERQLGLFISYAPGKNRYTMKDVRILSLIHDPLAIAMSNMLRHQDVVDLKNILADDNRFFQRQLLQISGDQIIGADSGLGGVMKMVRQAAPLDSPVMLLGETGVGKEIIANAIHNNSRRRNGPIIKVNCGAIPMSLMDSELFGHEKGAFTGAIARKRGRFERADGGSIFLDEIGDLPFAAQARLLRVLQEKEFDRVGGSETIRADVRVISATNRDLIDLVKKNRFREDLFYRLNVYPITIPPLRRRKEDIPPLVKHFIERKSKELRIQTPPPLGDEVFDRLKSHNWPGNVRELENWVERYVIQRQESPVYPVEDDVFSGGKNIKHNDDGDPENESDASILTMEQAARKHICLALKRCRGKVEGPGGAARLLEMHPSTLWSKLRKLHIQPGEFKKMEKW